MNERHRLASLEVDTAPKLDDQAIAKAKDMIGIWLRRDAHMPSQYEAISPHDIRRWSHYSVGDDNPLFCEPAYGQKTIWGGAIAPPTFLYTVDSCIVAPGMPGLQWIWASGDWEHFFPVRPGDVITAKARLIDLQVKIGKKVPRFINQVGEVQFTNQNGTLVSRYEGEIFRVPRSRSGQGFKFSEKGEKPAKARHQYSKEEIAEIAEAYRTEERRGAEPLYWEDVSVGQSLPVLYKGPLTLVDIVGFYSGRRTVYNVLKLAFLERDRHPGNVYVSPTTGIPVHPAAGHFDVEIAHEVGMPGAYDQGWQRLNWAGHLLTNWCGDMGFVRRMKGRVSVPNLVGDLTKLTGKVVDKSKQDGEALVHVIWNGANQHCIENCSGTATIRLPSRDLNLR